MTFTHHVLGNASGYPGTARHCPLLLKQFGFCIILQTEKESLWLSVPFYNTDYSFGQGQEPKPPASQDEHPVY